MIIAGLFGATIGSFLNVVIYRGPAMWGLIDPAFPRGNLIGPRSFCTNCRHQIPMLFLIPVAGFWLSNGRCGNCETSIPLRYPLVELGGALIAVISFLVFGLSISGLAAAFFGFSVLALAVIDLETGFLPDVLTAPLLITGLSVNSLGLFVSFPDAIMGAAIGGALFWIVGIVWRNLRGVDALGLGDAKLLAALGAWVGWQALPVIVFIASLTTLIVVFGTGLARDKSDLTRAVPFGPGLCLAGVLFLFGAGLIT